MNWGHKLLIVIILFLVTMIGVVFYASQQTNEMIDDQYYQKELKYQEVIDAKKNLNAVSGEPMLHQTPTEVVLHFPVGTFEKMESGSLELLRADNKSKDVSLTLHPNYSDLMVIPKQKLHKGHYQVRISWRNDQKAYYREETLFVE